MRLDHLLSKENRDFQKEKILKKLRVQLQDVYAGKKLLAIALFNFEGTEEVH